jgi:hypothetical protein
MLYILVLIHRSNWRSMFVGSCIFSMCDLARQMQRALQSHKNLADEDPARYYEWVHHKASRDQQESIHVVTGPIIGKVRAASWRSS